MFDFICSQVFIKEYLLCSLLFQIIVHFYYIICMHFQLSNTNFCNFQPIINYVSTLKNLNGENDRQCTYIGAWKIKKRLFAGVIRMFQKIGGVFYVRFKLLAKIKKPPAKGTILVEKYLHTIPMFHSPLCFYKNSVQFFRLDFAGLAQSHVPFVIKRAMPKINKWKQTRALPGEENSTSLD